MRSSTLLSAIAILCVLSCSKGGNAELPQLMRTVPSRSMAVMHFDRCDDALALLLDSTSVFRRLDYGRLGNAEIILSYDYSAGLIPLLSIDAGRASEDSSSTVRKALPLPWIVLLWWNRFPTPSFLTLRFRSTTWTS